MALSDFEARLERGVEGVVARVFRSGGVRPIEIARKLTREMDLSRTVGVNGESLVANAFSVELSPQDADALGEIEQAMRRELITLLRDHAGQAGYTVVGPIDVTMARGATRRSGTIGVSAALREDPRVRIYYLVLPTGDRVHLTGERVLIGRSADCMIVLADPGASRHHCEVALSGDQFVLSDLRSTNGTTVNGLAVQRHPLVSGDQIVIGGTMLKFVDELV